MTINIPIFKSVKLRHKYPKPDNGVATTDTSPVDTKPPSLTNAQNSSQLRKVRKWATIIACVLLFIAFIFLILVRAYLDQREHPVNILPDSNCANEYQASAVVDMVYPYQPGQHFGQRHYTRQRIPAAEFDCKIPWSA